MIDKKDNKINYYSTKKKIINVLKKNIKCIYNDEKCERVINSHTLSKKAMGYISSEKNELYIYKCLDYQKMQDIFKYKYIDFEKEHINNISIYNLFCSKHDNILFRDIDNNYIIPTNKQILMSHFRGLSLSYFMKTRDPNIIKQIDKADTKKDINMEIKKKKIQNLHPLSIKVNKHISDDFNKLLYSIKENKTVNINYKYIRFKKHIPFMCCEIISPVIDLYGNRLNRDDIKNNEYLNSYMNSLVSNDEKGGYILLTWNEKYKSLKQFALTVEKEINRFIAFLFLYSTNYCFSISWFDNLSVIKKQNLLKYASATKFLFRNNNLNNCETSIYRDWRKYIDFEIIDNKEQFI